MEPQTQILVLNDGYQLSYTILSEAEDSSKPLLVFIVGSVGLGAFYHRLATQLSSEFRCVYYDRRGFSASRKTQPLTQTDTNTPVIQRQAQDAASLITHLDHNRHGAYIFATSFGATIGLELALSYPKSIRKILLHEPMLPTLLPSGPQESSAISAFQRMPTSPTPFALFAETFLGVTTENSKGNDFWSRGPPGNLQQAMREAVAVTNYHPDLERLKEIEGRLMLLAGKQSKGLLVYEMTEALRVSLRSQRDIVELEGAHFSFVDKRNVERVGLQIRKALKEEGGQDSAKM